jgi:nitrogen PTS system EIIA component
MMRLSVREVARMLDASEATIERWIKNDNLPYHRVQGQVRFHRAELLEWANRHGIRIASDSPVSARHGGPSPRFSEALAAGGIHHVKATDRTSLIRAVIERMPIADDADRELLFDVLLARENAGSTGVGDGIAIPHVRSPVVLPTNEPSITLCFLDRPIDFDAIDGKPVHTVFAITAPTIRVHLSLLACLAAVLHDEEFHRAVIERAPAEVIQTLARRAQDRFARGSLPEINGFGDVEKG